MLMYINRALERTFSIVSSEYPVVFLDGPRQVGKTTLLKKLAENDNRAYISLDDLEIRRIANDTPQLFLQIYKPPILIDEVQYAPNLFPYIKMYVDQYHEMGGIWLTSSQQFRFLRGITESLAGRIAIISIFGLSLDEIRGQTDMGQFLPTFEALAERYNYFKQFEYMDIFEHIIRGGMPILYTNRAMDRDRYFKNYINSYISRDAVDYYGINSPSLFYKFLIACSARVAQLVNYSSMATEIGISVPTAKSWVQVLEAMGIVFLLPPYEKTRIKSITKTPKLYFMDTGFAAYLAGWPNGAVLEKSVQSGALFENLAISEIKKSIENVNDSTTRLYFYRDKNLREIDLLIEKERVIYPLEIKKSVNIDKAMIRNFAVLHSLVDYRIGNGGIVYPGNKILPLDDENYAIPIHLV